MAVDIKQICDYSDKLRNVSYILTETVGTTTSYTFPEDTLLPYIKRNLKEYIINHWDDEEIKEMVVALKKQAKVEMEEGWVGAVSIPEGDEVDINAVKDAVAAYALNQIESADLESLQYRVVKDGYSKGQLKGHLFPDVLPAFKKWTAEGKKIYMYSSGLELSQNCLISNSVEGDITELISGCFNSSEFPRTKSESFREMCKKVDCAADKVAFLTDNAPTARAARKAGLVVIMLCREGNSYMGSCIRESFPVITSFEDISQQICSKRKKPDDEIEVSGGKKAKLEESDADPEAKADDKCEETVKKDVPSMTKKAGEDSKLSEEKVKVEEEKVVPTTEEAEEKMEVDEETKAEETASETKAEETASETKAAETASETKAAETASETKAAETASETKATETASETKAAETASETKAAETASETKAAETASETKAAETASETKEKTATDTKEEPASVAIVVTPPEDDVKKDEVGGEEKMDGVEEVKKADAKEEVEKATVAEDERKAENVAKEESSKPKEESKKDKKAEESTEPKVEEKETKDGALEEKTIEGKPKAEEKADEDKPSAEKESDEKKISEDVSKVENGDAIPEKESVSSDAATENGEAGKEMCTNGVDHENGEGKENGVSSDEKAESTEKEAVKAVPKKPELESVTEAATQESA